MLPEKNILLNDWLAAKFNLALADYYTLMGPCHAEEVANEKLSYLTFSGLDENKTAAIAEKFNNTYINTIINQDVIGGNIAILSFCQKGRYCTWFGIW
jgi:glycerol-3-phosphate dehydrogenase (NAD(P)+)